MTADTKDGSARVAVVTGANKGIGLSIVRLLALQYPSSTFNSPPRPLVVYLTGRSAERCQAAADEIRSEVQTAGVESVDVRHHVLDVTDLSQINSLATFLVSQHGQLCIDALVCNAGVSYPDADLRPHVVAEVMGTNYWGVRDVAATLWPHLRQGARVVFIGSMIGRLSMVSPTLREKFLSEETGPDDIDTMMHRWVELLARETDPEDAGGPEKEGYYRHVYCTAKMGVHCLARALAREEDKRPERERVVVVACCPGAVYTDQTAKYGPRHLTQLSPDQGADTPAWLILHTSVFPSSSSSLPPRDSSQLVPGAFYRRRKRSEEVWSSRALTYRGLMEKRVDLNTFVEELPDE